MPLQRLSSYPRMLWRDIILWASDATERYDELMGAYFFSDTAYQYTWSKLDVHETLLKDEVRVRAFEEALKQTVKPGYRVLDLGTGTGILAFLAAKAGAKEVIGVDSASILDVAEKTRARNRLENVRFVRTDLRDLSIQKVDLIVCELIGMRITDEGIVGKLANARRHLKSGAHVMPSRIDIFLAPVESQDMGLGFWKQLYGLDYSAVDTIRREIRNYDLSKAKILSTPKKAFSIDLTSKETPRLEFSGEFEMEADCEFNGCAMWFEAKLSNDVTLSTDPRMPLTHWKQLFLPDEKRRPLARGQKLKVDVRSELGGTKWGWKFRS